MTLKKSCACGWGNCNNSTVLEVKERQSNEASSNIEVNSMQQKQKSKCLTIVPSWTNQTDGKRVDNGDWVQVEDEEFKLKIKDLKGEKL
jgi:hypothetical protein